MEKVIKIRQGNEYRAREKDEFYEGNILEETYLKADAILCEIIEAEEQFRKEKSHARMNSYNGMSNNIIAFCGDRGQGKTSTMLSYSAFLTQKRSGKPILSGNEQKCLHDVLFKVLNPIDPSTMHKKESIVRVLLSRMFYETEQYADDIKNNQISREQIRKISELFQKCYSAINSIENGKTGEDNDLDSLAQMGDSSGLKQYLYQLIEQFLNLMIHEEMVNKYLVIQIDDTDLAKGDVFQFCEDIRTYFAIPNVIVLMASDYRQLETAIQQEHLKRYGDIIDRMKELEVEEMALNMSAKYLEKILPSTHVIMLPNVSQLISSKDNAIKIKYTNKNDEDVFSEIVDYDSIQSQILKLLYTRTGVILVLDQNRNHPFLPKTFRELTHWLKLFDNMHPIDFKKAYKIETTGQDAEATKVYKKELEYIRDNIELFKEYFIQDWCSSHLKADQYVFIKKLDATNGTDRIKDVFALFKKALNMGETGETYTYQKLMQQTDIHLDDDINFRIAIQMYFTIFMHCWYSYAVEDENTMQAFLAYLGHPFPLEKEMDEHNIIDNDDNRYNMFHFDFDINKVQTFLGVPEIDAGTKSIIQNYYIKEFSEKTEDGMEEEELLIEIDNKILINEILIEEPECNLKFDMLQPIVGFMQTGIWKNFRNEKQEKQSSLTDGERHDASERENDESINYLISFRNIVINYEIRKHIQQEISREIKRIKRKGTDKSWEEIYHEICLILNPWKKYGIEYVDEDSTVGDRCFEYLKENSAVAQAVFLSNTGNEEKYRRQYKNLIVEQIAACKKQLERIKQAKNRNNIDKDPSVAIFADMKNMIKPPSIFETIKVKGLEKYKECQDELKRIIDDAKNELVELDNDEIAKMKKENVTAPKETAALKEVGGTQDTTELEAVPAVEDDLGDVKSSTEQASDENLEKEKSEEEDKDKDKDYQEKMVKIINQALQKVNDLEQEVINL